MKITFSLENGDNTFANTMSADDVKFDEVVELFKSFLVLMGYHPGMINTVFDDDE